MSEREYAVSLHRGVDADQFNQDMIALTGDGAIPNRSVDIANARPGSYRITHYSLTDEEAVALRADPRVYGVNIPPEQDPNLVISRRSSYIGNFNKTSSGSSDEINWGLVRCNNSLNVYGQELTSPDDRINYVLDGRGVDVVIQDSGVQPDHPEYADRYQSIDWWVASGLNTVGQTQNPNHDRDFNGHGTHVAGIACGYSYGWAKGAHVYSQKIAGLEGTGDSGTGHSASLAFDMIKEWHKKKNNPNDPSYTGRPTVVNMSWGYSFTLWDTDWNVGAATGVHQGSSWTYGSTYTNRTSLFFDTGIWPALYYNSARGDYYIRVPVRVPSVDVDVQEMIDAGIIVCIAAGNTPFLADLPGGVEYDNYFDMDLAGYPRQRYYYHRGSSPMDDEAFIVGNIDSSPHSSNADKASTTSTRGPAVNIWAPGTNIKSSCSTITDFSGSAPYINDVSYKQLNISGTSMASPQVAGLAACYMGLNRKFTPAQLRDYMFKAATTHIYDSGITNDYYTLSGGTNPFALMGSPVRMLYNKFAVPLDGAMTGGIQMNNCIVKQA